MRRIAAGGRTQLNVADAQHEVVIVGGGAAGIAVAASLAARARPGLDVAIVDPADMHYYQPGWTMVGGGVFDPGHRTHDGLLLPRACTGSRPPWPPSSRENDA